MFGASAFLPERKGLTKGSVTIETYALETLCDEFFLLPELFLFSTFGCAKPKFFLMI